MRISKQTKKTTLAQQGRYLLICLLSMLLLFLAGSVLILNRTQRQRGISERITMFFSIRRRMRAYIS